MIDSVKKYYEYFYTKISGNLSYVFRPTLSEEAMISNFLLKVGEDAGESFLFKYMCYQFHYWHDKDTRFGKGKIQLGWVIGEKAMSRWNGSKEDHWYHYSTDLSKKFGVSKNDLNPVNSSKLLDVTSIPRHEEADRMLYHNTKKGLIFCLDFTSMWHGGSNACNTCDNVIECKNMMKTKLSAVYLIREGASSGND